MRDKQGVRMAADKINEVQSRLTRSDRKIGDRHDITMRHTLPVNSKRLSCALHQTLSGPRIGRHCVAARDRWERRTRPDQTGYWMKGEAARNSRTNKSSSVQCITFQFELRVIY